MTWLVSRVMQVLVVTSCTGWKAVTSRSELTLEDFDDPDKLAAREAQLSGLLRPASVMYTGRQHVAAMRGVDAIRAALGSQSVDVAIVSAGYGVVGETRPIAPLTSRSPVCQRLLFVSGASDSEFQPQCASYSRDTTLCSCFWEVTISPPSSRLSSKQRPTSGVLCKAR
jgi:hypothetical protein